MALHIANTLSQNLDCILLKTISISITQIKIYLVVTNYNQLVLSLNILMKKQLCRIKFKIMILYDFKTDHT